MKKRVILGIVVMTVLLASFFGFGYVKELYDVLLEYMEQYVTGGNIYYAAIFFTLAAALSAFFAFFSSVVLVPFAVILFGNTLTFILLLSGWVLGAAALYGIAYYFGYPVMTRLVEEKKINKWIERFSKDSGFLFAFFFRLLTPSETGLVFGLLRYNFLKYMIISFFAELPFAVAVVFAGITALSFF